MSAPKNNHLFTLAAILVAGVILWLLLRGNNSGVVNYITNQAAPVSVDFPEIAAYVPQEIPPLNYVPANISYIGGSKGCLMCYSGYERIETPTPAPKYVAPPAAQIYNYFMPSYQPPKPRYWMTTN